MKKLNQKGFSHIEVILIIIVLVLVGGAGFYVLKHDNKRQNDTSSQTNNTTAEPTKQSTTTPKTTDPYSDWKSATLQYEKIAYKYPSNWTINDQSVASPKSVNGCSYPGHDIVTLTSPSGSTMKFNAGQACFGYSGDKSFGSIPVRALGQDMYIGFLAYNDDSKLVSKPDSACLVLKPDSNDRFMKSKNIFFNDADSKPTSNVFCYIPKDAATVEVIKDSPDFPTAKLIFESMNY